MLQVYGNTINMVSGDTGILAISLAQSTVGVGDLIYFTVRNSIGEQVLQKINQPADTVNVVAFPLNHVDTNDWPAGEYVYDIQFNLASGAIVTPIGPSKLFITGGITHE